MIYFAASHPFPPGDSAEEHRRSEDPLPTSAVFKCFRHSNYFGLVSGQEYWEELRKAKTLNMDDLHEVR